MTDAKAEPPRRSRSPVRYEAQVGIDRDFDDYEPPSEHIDWISVGEGSRMRRRHIGAS